MDNIVENIEPTYIPTSFLVYGMFGWSLKALIGSLSSGIDWKIICAAIGFCIFLGLAVIYTKGLYQMTKEKNHASD